MSQIPPWANGPFELIVHAEGHLRKGDDFDRRIALISFDNAIEVSITTYLSLHPIQRANKTYPNADVEKWLHNYHSKLDFLGEELKTRNLPWDVEKSHIIWAHEHRNEQYHGGNKGTPEKQVLSLIRKTALWIFGLLYDVFKPEEALEQAIIAALPPQPPQRDPSFDRVIDREHGMVDVGDQCYYCSEVLFAVDPDAYREIGGRLNEAKADKKPDEEGEG